MTGFPHVSCKKAPSYSQRRTTIRAHTALYGRTVTALKRSLTGAAASPQSIAALHSGAHVFLPPGAKNALSLSTQGEQKSVVPPGFPLRGAHASVTGGPDGAYYFSAPGLRDHFHPTGRRLPPNGVSLCPGSGMYFFPSKSLTDDIISKFPHGVKVSPLFPPDRRLFALPRSAAFRIFPPASSASLPRCRPGHWPCPASSPGHPP